MRRYLVVANQTLGGDHLVAALRRRLEHGSCSFYVVVPASPPGDHTWTEGEIRAVAQERLDKALTRFRELGAEVDGEVGDPSPFMAVEDAIRTQEFDEIILSTLPPGMSRWLKKDLPHRIARITRVPVKHLIAEPERASKAG
jgi:hypothetical protein